MPKGATPERYRDILEGKVLGHLAAIGPDGRPQVNSVWFFAVGARVHLSLKPETAKYRTLAPTPPSLRR